VRLSSSPIVERISEIPNSFKNISLTMNFNCSMIGDKIDYINSFYELKSNNGNSSEKDKGIFFHPFSYKISGTTGTYNLLTFYSTFIILIGNYIRIFFTSGADRIIITDMPEPENLITLCEGIKISRYRHDFER